MGLQNCDDCQLKYGGPKTTAAWNAEKPPSGAPLGTGQLATIVDIEYQLPADFECPNAVFSWLWHTPHLCIPKEVADKRAENDFWAFCNRNLEGFYGACRTEWQDEIFINCMDAQVGDGGNFSSPSQPLSPEPISQPVPQPTSQPISLQSLNLPLSLKLQHQVKGTVSQLVQAIMQQHVRLLQQIVNYTAPSASEFQGQVLPQHQLQLQHLVLLLMIQSTLLHARRLQQIVSSTLFANELLPWRRHQQSDK